MLRSYLFTSADLARMLRCTTLGFEQQAMFLRTLGDMHFSVAGWIHHVLSYYMIDYTVFTESVDTMDSDYDHIHRVFEPVFDQTDNDIDIWVVKHHANPEKLSILQQLYEAGKTDDLYTTIANRYPPLYDQDEEGVQTIQVHLELFMEATEELVRMVETLFLRRQVRGAYSYASFVQRGHNLLISAY